MIPESESENPGRYVVNPAYVPAIETVRHYLRSTVGDHNGLAMLDGDVRDCTSDECVHVLLVSVLVARFTVDILEESGTSHDPLHIENLEDRQDVIDTLDRVGIARPANFASFFPLAFNYALKNVHNDELS